MLPGFMNVNNPEPAEEITRDELTGAVARAPQFEVVRRGALARPSAGEGVAELGSINVPTTHGLIRADRLPDALAEFARRAVRGPYKVMTAAVPWSRHDSADPVENLRHVWKWGSNDAEDFGPGATAYMNVSAVSHLVRNRNPKDLDFWLRGYLNGARSVVAANTVLRALGLPLVEVFDEHVYVHDKRAYRPIIPDDKVIVAGRRHPDYGDARDWCFVVINV